MRIQLLDKSVYELIAAGEVIERPSSVIKELLENSIDAGSTNITVEIKNGGRTFMRVTDNGCGIAKEDIPLAFYRHATSKIIEKNDLTAISTLGFRGEALASVCAVAKVEMLSKRRSDMLGAHYLIEGGEQKNLEESGCPNGTTIIVRDLFYNVPARLKFLKKDVSEGNAVANVVTKIALSHPEISFKFIRDNKTDLVTSGDGKVLSAIYAVMGREFHGSVIPVDYTLNGVVVSGYVTKPLMSKANRSFQNFFVNSRYVKSVTCMVALEEAYRNTIMTGKFPSCVLSIDLDPANVDVNVHPAKIEIRFSDEKPVYDAVYFAVKNALMTLDKPMETGLSVASAPVRKTLTQEEIFKKPAPSEEQLALSSTPAAQLSERLDKSENSKFIRFERRPIKIDVPADEKRPAELPKIKVNYRYVTESEIKKSAELSAGSKEEAASVPKPAMPKPDAEPQKPPVEYIGEAFRTYIIVQRGEDLYLMDKHAAHERYNFDSLKSGYASVDIQSILNPFDMALSYENHAAVGENLALLRRFGFEIEMKDPPNIRVYGVPIILTEEDPTDLLTTIADSLAAGKKGAADEIYDDLFHSIACKASIKAKSFSSPDELKKLAQLVIDNEIRYCPHGRPAIVKLTKTEIEKLFKRIV